VPEHSSRVPVPEHSRQVPEHSSRVPEHSRQVPDDEFSGTDDFVPIQVEAATEPELHRDFTPEPEPITYEPPPPQVSFARQASVLEAKPSLGKLAAGVAVLGLVGVAIFAFSSDANMRLVKRKAREAVMGRKAGGMLTIESLPTGALVFFDDEPTGKTTPIKLDNVESQVVHHVRVELQGETPTTATVSVTANASQTLSLVFKDAIVDLRVKSDPIGAEVHKNGRQVALTPTTMPVRAGEPFKLALKKLGYETFEQQITPERGKPVDLDVPLVKGAELLAAEEAEKAALQAAEDERNGKRKAKRKKRRR
jgi:hypothetical protein